jgi:hypothetical protein
MKAPPDARGKSVEVAWGRVDLLGPKGAVYGCKLLEMVPTGGALTEVNVHLPTLELRELVVEIGGKAILDVAAHASPLSAEGTLPAM